MSRLQNLPYSLQEAFLNRSVLKIISGLNNFDKALVEKVAKSAFAGGADLIDIACDPDLVKSVKAISGLPVCVSSVEPQRFPEVVEAGATMIEIGNFDSFYPLGRYFTPAEVLSLTTETRELLPKVVLSVTVPHFLPLDQQSKLALDLINAGADLIQTEGGTSSSPLQSGTIGLIEKATPTLGAVHTISQTFLEAACEAPIICASGLSEVTVPMAFSVGASGVGVGSVVNRLDNEVAMIAMVRNLREKIDSYKSLPSNDVYKSEQNVF